MSGYRLDVNGNLVPSDPFASWNAPVSTMDQVSQLSTGGDWLAPVNGPGVPGMPSGAPAGFGEAAGGFGGLASGGVLSGQSPFSKIGSWFGKNGAAIGQWGNLASQGIQAYLGLKQLSMAKDALSFEKKAFKTNLKNSVSAYNTQMKDRITGRQYATEEERQAALKAAELSPSMGGG